MPAVTAPVTIFFDETRKTLRFSGPLAVRELATVTLLPAAAAAGTVILTLMRYNETIAEANIENAAGAIDLSTTQAVKLFTALPAHQRIDCKVHLWHDTDKRLLATGRCMLVNNPEAARSTVRMAAAGELTMELAAALDAGTPVKRDALGKAAAVQAGEAHLYLGIAVESGLAGDTVRVVSAGLAAVAGWGLDPGRCYYLAHGVAALTATAPAGYNERPVGIAIDESTLALLNNPVVQSQADSAVPHTVAWESATQRFIARTAARTSSGPADEGRIPCLDVDGKLNDSLLHPFLRHSIFYSVADLPTDPTVHQVVELLNLILLTLKGPKPWTIS